MIVWIAAAHALPLARPPALGALDGIDDSSWSDELRERRFDLSSPGNDVEVVGGQRDAAYGAAVALVFPRLGAFCSASMITPRVALTAGHCVNEQGITPALIEQGAKVHWGPTSDAPTQVADILRVIVHPGYGLTGQGLPENDIALILIEPVEYTDTVWFNEVEVTDAMRDDTFYSVGFGINENGENSSGKKRSAEITLDEFLGDFLVSDADTNPRRANVCSGDSGGPMYGYGPDGRLLQFAVHSWSQPPECRGIAGSTSTAKFTTFILNGIETLQGSSDMCVNREINDDIYCDPGCPDDVICASLELGEAKAGKACQTGGTGAFWLLGFALAGLARRSTR